jgi:hypothetical protein
MTSDTLELPRLDDADVGGGIDLTEDTNDGSAITMYSYLYNGKQTLAEANVEDIPADVLGGFTAAWLNRLAIQYDNGCIGVSGARSATVSDFRPYTSILAAVRATDSDAGYTADDNYLASSLSYANVNTILGLVEAGDFSDEGSMVWLAHPSLKVNIRNLLDEQSRPIFIDANGTLVQSTLMGVPILFTKGARVSTSFKMTTTGAPLLACVSTNHLVHGARIEPESRLIDASMNVSQLAHTLQHRARKGFALRFPQAAAVLAVTS